MLIIGEILIYWVYMIEVNRKNKKTFYIGYTSNLSKRIDQHRNNKGARYTMGEKTIKLVYTESYPTKSEAMKREFELKKLKRIEKENLVKNYSSIPEVKNEI